MIPAEIAVLVLVFVLLAVCMEWADAASDARRYKFLRKRLIEGRGRMNAITYDELDYVDDEVAIDDAIDDLIYAETP